MPRSRNFGQRPSYPRTARVNALVQEVLAEQIEALADADDRLDMLTITGVNCEPDLRHAAVFFASISKPAQDALEAHRPKLQASLGRQTQLKRIPVLSFLPDPAIIAGTRVEEVLRRLQDSSPTDEQP